MDLLGKKCDLIDQDVLFKSRWLGDSRGGKIESQVSFCKMRRQSCMIINTGFGNEGQ